MREGFAVRNTWWVRIICDHCGKTIGEEVDDKNATLSMKYRGLNNDHECTACRKSRERRYDIWVLSRD